MTDTIIKGTGNSRSLRTVPNALTLYPDFQSMMQAMINGTFPIDIGPTNATGIEKIGTDLTKANILTDATEQSIWGNVANRTPNEALAQLRSLITTAQNTASGKLSAQTGYYAGTGGATTRTLNSSFTPKAVFVAGAGANPGISAMIYGTSQATTVYTSSNGTVSMYYISPTWGTNSVSWTCDTTTTSIRGTLNISGGTYYWIAIG